MQIDQLYDIIKDYTAEYVLAEQALSTNKMSILKEKAKQQTYQMGKAYVMRVGQDAQNEVKEFIEDTVTFAIQIVYGNAYEFKSEFIYDKRDQFEIKWFIEEDGHLLEPRQDTISGGLTDICAFSLRLVIHAMESPEPAPILIIYRKLLGNNIFLQNIWFIADSNTY